MILLCDDMVKGTCIMACKKGKGKKKGGRRK